MTIMPSEIGYIFLRILCHTSLNFWWIFFKFCKTLKIHFPKIFKTNFIWNTKIWFLWYLKCSKNILWIFITFCIGNGSKKQETDQQTENLLPFQKTGKWQKNMRKRIKKKGNRPVYWKFITFLKDRKQNKNLRKPIEKKNRKTINKHWKRTKKLRKRMEILRKPVNKLKIF